MKLFFLVHYPKRYPIVAIKNKTFLDCFYQGKQIHAFLYKQQLYKQRQAKNQANAKQHPEAKILLLENCSHSSSTLSSKNNRTHSQK